MITSENNINIEDIFLDKLDLDKSVYRNQVKIKERYNFRVIFKHSDLLIKSNKNIKNKIELPLKEIYRKLEYCIENYPPFLKSLSPIKPKSYFPKIIKKMCEKSSIFGVGPMATVAGAVCEYCANYLLNYCSRLIIENGGDVFIKINRDIDVAVYLKNRYFKDKIRLKIKAKNIPCGLCSSSGSFGHSLSFGKSDLVVVMANSAITADGAATAIANKINSVADIQKSINYFKDLDESIKGIVIVKEKKIGLWGNIELVV